MKKLFAAASFFLLAVTTMTNAHAATEVASSVITVKSPEVRLVSANANSAEGFMNIQNNGIQSHVLIAAYTPTDQETVLHKTVIKNGQPVMREVKQILIPAKSATGLKFDGLHIMLMDLQKPLQANTTVPLILLFDDGSALSVPLQVVS